MNKTILVERQVGSTRGYIFTDVVLSEDFFANSFSGVLELEDRLSESLVAGAVVFCDAKGESMMLDGLIVRFNKPIVVISPTPRESTRLLKVISFEEYPDRRDEVLAFFRPPVEQETALP